MTNEKKEGAIERIQTVMISMIEEVNSELGVEEIEAGLYRKVFGEVKLLPWGDISRENIRFLIKSSKEWKVKEDNQGAIFEWEGETVLNLEKNSDESLVWVIQRDFYTYFGLDARGRTGSEIPRDNVKKDRHGAVIITGRR